MKYKNGDKYDGEFANGVKDGLGTYVYFNGDKYTGEWVDDRKCG